jgi:hypothetical protein
MFATSCSKADFVVNLAICKAEQNRKVTLAFSASQASLGWKNPLELAPPSARVRPLKLPMNSVLSPKPPSETILHDLILCRPTLQA